MGCTAAVSAILGQRTTLCKLGCKRTGAETLGGSGVVAGISYVILIDIIALAEGIAGEAVVAAICVRSAGNILAGATSIVAGSVGAAGCS